MRNRRSGSVSVVPDNIRREIYDLFELSPLTVLEIAKAYGFCRLTVYRIVWRIEGIKDVSRPVKGRR